MFTSFYRYLIKYNIIQRRYTKQNKLGVIFYNICTTKIPLHKQYECIDFTPKSL
jgi:hypothetical protein